MGLAASQARLLTITARKADCEFQSMSLSHQKIALSRDMENVSTEYQEALNQTKLVYDYYGSGTSQMDLTYDLLMKPSIYNDYYPKLITDSLNRVILDSRYAAAAIAAGIPTEGLNGTSSSEVRDKFICALAGETNDGMSVKDSDGKTLNIITEGAKEIIINTTYNNTISLGASFSATEATKNVTYEELLEKIEAYTLSTEDYGLEEFGGKVTADVWGDRTQFLTYNRETNDERDKGNYHANNTYIYVDETNMTSGGNSYSISLADLLKGEHNYTYSIRSSDRYPVSDAAFLQQIIVGGEYDKSFLNWMVDQFSTVLGGITENDLALQYAYNNIYDMIFPNNNIQTWGEKRIEKNKYQGGEKELGYIATNKSFNAKDAPNYMGCIYGTKGIAVNLNNLAKAFLTSYVEYIQGVDTSTYNYDIGKLSDTNLYQPKDSDIFIINGNTTNVDSGSDNLLAGFYDALFNQICVNGWTRNNEIGTNPAYLQELMKNGSVFISSMNNDGYYYQGNYSTDVYIAEITDSEAVARAEAKYNAEKAKIENKENTIDMKMKNLDTEISSLTTEYDTTKSIITKAIEKSFKRYEA